MQIRLAVLAAFALASITYSEACSCMRTHPQQHYCQADFAILARIKSSRAIDSNIIYKVRIRKEYKMSEKARVALKSGRLLTSIYDSMCGVYLPRGQLFVITGKVISLKAHVNMCNFYRPWNMLTKRQRKGFNRMYQLGCTCKIKDCRREKCGRTKEACNWSSHYEEKDCQEEQGICLRSISRNCMWSRNAAQTRCMRNSTDIMMQKPLTISRWSG